MVMDDLNKNPSKMFIGGLGQETSSEGLREHFSKYGEIADCAVVMDRRVGRSRGFGFVTFVDTKAVEHAMIDRHKIDGVLVECRRALPRDEARQAAPHDSVNNPCKLFVGGLPEDLQEEEFRGYFERRYGKVKDAVLAYDKTNHRPRGFGFIVFENPDHAEAACGSHTIKGRAQCEAKHAVPRDAPGPRGRRPFDDDRFKRDWYEPQFRGGGPYSAAPRPRGGPLYDAYSYDGYGGGYGMGMGMGGGYGYAAYGGFPAPAYGPGFPPAAVAGAAYPPNVAYAGYAGSMAPPMPMAPPVGGPTGMVAPTVLSAPTMPAAYGAAPMAPIAATQQLGAAAAGGVGGAPGGYGPARPAAGGRGVRASPY
ncbi:unnamed protein product [Vitrella brassicaformis CCMP3155]|uniref:RRM domain-containing protein n=2 Tax=Vitrella brassicaformis TaxID=1169539 RepID=A0A0G4G506_VITBC|nr:unnamed protein product [Vitrella brassicaformis CCMP3155]|eukprot:CEM23488.1 unnamed protein product [Vitrella brassicaformis CCMP3155]